MHIEWRTAAGIFFCVLASACGGGSTTPESGGDDGLSGAIRVDGSSTVFPISEAVAEEFKESNPSIDITVGISGTGGGFQKFCRGEIDISDASRPIRAVEMEACKNAGIDYIELPIAYDGLAVVVNPSNNWATSMTTAELKTLWQPEAQNKVMRWNQVRSSWPDREILPLDVLDLVQGGGGIHGITLGQPAP